MLSTKKYLFFLSYARDDRENDQDCRIERFYSDLREYIRRRCSNIDGEIGFLDTRSATTGDFWTPTADQALRTCKVFVCIYSPTYFTREYCGKEWQLFQSRLNDYKNTEAGRDTPSLIMPVLFVGKPLLEAHIKRMPETIQDVVYRHDSDPAKYVEEGLEIFMLGKYADDYKEFLSRFANRLIELSEKHPLPERPDLPSVRTVNSAFERAVQPGVVAAANQDDDQEYVDFLFVAGRRTELARVKDYVGCYGESGSDWKPYEPPLGENIGQTVQRIARQESFLSRIMELDENLIGELKKAKNKNRIVAIIVDSWTLLLNEYADLIGDYDMYDFLNSVMLVCWNTKDEETKRKRVELEEAVQAVFSTKMMRGATSNFLFPVSTSRQFEDKLVASLNKIRMDLLNFSLDELRHRRIKELDKPGARSQAAAHKFPFMLPIISGTGGVLA